MKCSGCGTEVGGDVAFCPKCGTKVGAAPTGAPAASLTGKSPPSASSDVDSEVELWSGGYSGKAMAGSWVVAGLASIGLIVAAVLVPEYTWIFIGAIAAIWIILGLILVYRKWSIHYEVTTHRFNHQSGILTRTSDRIEMIDIDDVTFSQGIVERMLNVGSIKLSSSDRTHPVLHLAGISDVRRVADMIDDARRKERRKRGLHIEHI
jgi:membrane protein YdbS with pleckstrin-like domain